MDRSSPDPTRNTLDPARTVPDPAAPRTKPPVVERIAGWSIRHRRTTVVGWLVLVAAVVVLTPLLSTPAQPAYDPGESGRAQRILHDAGVTAPSTEAVLVQRASTQPGSGGGARIADDPTAVVALGDVVTALTALPGSVLAVQSPLAAGHEGQFSPDGRSAIVTFTLTGDAEHASEAVTAPLAAVAEVQARYPALRIEEAGNASLNVAVNDIVGQDFRRGEVSSVPITLLILLTVFGALVAAGIPILLAGSAVAAAIALLAIPGRWFPIDATASSLILLIGMAVGIDYSLFYLRREREERHAGQDPIQALRIAAATSGRAIAVSGGTVMVSLAGLFLTGIGIFSGMAFGTMAVVGIAVIGSLTVLPAMLAWLGPHVDRGRVPLIGRRRTGAEDSRLWQALVRRVVRHPVVFGGTAALALIVLAVPALGLRLGNGGLAALPPSSTAVTAMQRVEQAFPGKADPATVVVTGRDLGGSQVSDAVNALRARAASSGGLLGSPVTAAPAASGRILLVRVPLDAGAADTGSDASLRVLREQVLPETLGRVPGISYAVTGGTAGNHDFSSALRWRSPIVVAFVLALAFVLLLCVFRSIVIPLTGIALTGLSVGAAYGVVKLVFQDGHLQSLLGFRSYGAITPWMPLFMFVLLFGLSMDYHVFMLSRIRELRLRGADTRDAVVGGISGSAGVVTSAAVIMVAVFSIFATLSLLPMKIFGVGMAVAVLIDATLVRGVLLPAAMTLLGERNWYLPAWLAWLPGRSEASTAGHDARPGEGTGAAAPRIPVGSGG